MDPVALPPDVRLGHVRLRVGDLVRARAFYEDVLGLRAVPGDGAAAAFGAGDDAGAAIVLLEPGATIPRPRRTVGLYHFAILFPDRAALGRAFHRFRRAGWPILGMSDHAVSEAIYLADPDGNGIELYADRPRARWPRLPDGELYMTTEPLDLPDLLREPGAGDEERAAPAGTHLGHIHLHVSELDRAEEFYAGALGFDVVTRRYPGALFMSAGGYHHHVAVNVWAGVGAPRAPAGAAGLIDFSIVFPGEASLAHALERLRAHGAEPRAPAADGPAAWRVADPDGNGVVLTVDR